jgi:hypothetical protein
VSRRSPPRGGSTEDRASRPIPMPTQRSASAHAAARLDQDLTDMRRPAILVLSRSAGFIPLQWSSLQPRSRFGKHLGRSDAEADSSPRGDQTSLAKC